MTTDVVQLVKPLEMWVNETLTRNIECAKWKQRNRNQIKSNHATLLKPAQLHVNCD